MDRASFQRWLDAYLAAWQSYDPAAIGALFSTDAEYRYHPWDDPLRGRDRIVADWLAARDDPGSWRAAYEVVACEGDVCVATGRSDYLTADRSAVDRSYFNAFVCRFDADGRCRGFTEYFMKQPKAKGKA